MTVRSGSSCWVRRLKRHGLVPLLAVAALATALATMEGVALAAEPWQEQAELGHDVPVGGTEGFGISVAVDGNLAVVGGQRGRANVFLRDQSGGWTLEQTITATAPAGALAVAVSEDPVEGDTVVIGNASSSVGATFGGAVIIYRRNEFGTWVSDQALVSDDIAGSDRLGISVAMEADTIIAGANEENGAGTDRGAAYVFTRDGAGTWSQQAKLQPADLADSDEFGTSVDLSGDRAIVGVPLSSASDPGAAYTYERTGSAWTEAEKLIPGDTADLLQFGISVGLSGETAVVGSAANKAYAFRDDAATGWLEEDTLLPLSGSGTNGFGRAVAMDGQTAAIGAGFANAASAISSGAAWIFGRDNFGDWSVESDLDASLELQASDASANFAFGWSVAIQGSTAVVGSLRHDENADEFGVNGNAYVFSGSDYAFVDQRAPSVSDLLLTPDSAGPGDDVMVSATADDSSAGNSTITGAEYQIDGGLWQAMLATDNSFDAPSEGVEATIAAGSLGAGLHDVCVRATDAGGNTGTAPVCDQFSVQSQMVPLTATITFVANDAPLLDPSSDPDFYARVHFAESGAALPGPDLPNNGVGTIANSSLIEPFWEFTGEVSNSGGTAEVVVEIWDADPPGDDDDKTDINPAAGVDRLFVTVDLVTGLIDGTSTTTVCSMGDEGLRRVEACVVVGLGSDHDVDDDGLLNAWELHGIDVDGDGTIDFDLPGLGADPCRKTLATEIDYMDSSITGFNHRPLPGTLTALTESFDAAPVPAAAECPFPGFPTSGRGINLLIDLDDVVPEQDGEFSLDGDFEDVRADFFDERLLPFVYYSLWIHAQDDGDSTSGVCCRKGGFLVSLGLWDKTVENEAGTFMHEFGHALGLPHGGIDQANFKPNYLSVMSYLFQTSWLTDSIDPSTPILDYSREALPALNENALTEEALTRSTMVTAWLGEDFGNVFQGTSTPLMGVLNQPLDWNGNGVIDDFTVIIDLNGDSVCVDDGPDNLLQTVATGDDLVRPYRGSQQVIVSGGDDTCDTAADPASDDEQVLDVDKMSFSNLVGYDDWANIAYRTASFINGQGAPLGAPDHQDIAEPEAAELKAFWAAARVLLANPPPDVTLTTPAEGAVFAQGQVVNADFSCTDVGSGVASCVGDVADGSPIDTSVGAHTFTVTGIDDVGNTTVVTHNYIASGPDCTEPQSHPFTDVPTSSFAYEAVGCIYALGVTTGTSPTAYSPSGDVTREQMAAFLARFYEAVTGKPCGGSHPFTDVPTSSFAYDAVGCIFNLGVTTGTSATTYSPGGNVTREQMAAFIARLYRTITETGCSAIPPFIDVPVSSFARTDIGCIYNLGVTTGTSPTTYSPGGNVTREQMAAFLARLYGTIART